jgi:hypothetical protein
MKRMMKFELLIDSAVPTVDMITIFGTGGLAARMAEMVFRAHWVRKSSGRFGSSAEKGLSLALGAFRVTKTASIGEAENEIALEMSASLNGDPTTMSRPFCLPRDVSFLTRAVT